MSYHQFPCFSASELEEIKINGISPESMTEAYPSFQVREPRYKKNMKSDNDCFVASTQKSKPVFRFRNGQNVNIDCPFGLYSHAVCIGQIDYMHKGFRMVGYLFQYS